jgi:Sec-independent protein translocase protein TatA
MIDLIKLLPEGSSVIAVIVVVIIFLKNQREFHVSLKEITKEFTDRVSSMQAVFQSQIDRLSTNFLATEKIHQEQIQNLFSDFISVSRETVIAVKELEAAVRELRMEVKGRADEQSKVSKK